MKDTLPYLINLPPFMQKDIDLDSLNVLKKSLFVIKGKLVGLMQDRQNARLMNVEPTGNGRRQSYAHQPMPRMSNTLMASGKHDPLEILKGTKKGV